MEYLGNITRWYTRENNIIRYNILGVVGIVRRERLESWSNLGGFFGGSEI